MPLSIHNTTGAQNALRAGLFVRGVTWSGQELWFRISDGIVLQRHHDSWLHFSRLDPFRVDQTLNWSAHDTGPNGELAVPGEGYMTFALQQGYYLQASVQGWTPVWFRMVGDELQCGGPGYGWMPADERGLQAFPGRATWTVHLNDWVKTPAHTSETPLKVHDRSTLLESDWIGGKIERCSKTTEPARLDVLERDWVSEPKLVTVEDRLRVIVAGFVLRMNHGSGLWREFKLSDGDIQVRHSSWLEHGWRPARDTDRQCFFGEALTDSEWALAPGDPV